MKKLVVLSLTALVFSASAFAATGVNTEENCKDIVAKIQAAKDQHAQGDVAIDPKTGKPVQNGSAQ